jgi:hypothetical protein
MELVTLYGAPFDVSTAGAGPSTKGRLSGARAGVGSISPPADPAETLSRHVISPQIGRPELAERHLGGFLADLTRQFGKHGAGVARGGGEPGAERVPGTAAAVEPGVARLA